MMRVAPCEEPRSCPGSYRSMPSTRTPRTARRCSAALPITPSPITTTSKRAISCPAPPRLARYCEYTCYGMDVRYGKWLPPCRRFRIRTIATMRLILLGVLVWLGCGLAPAAAAIVPCPRRGPLRGAPGPAAPSASAPAVPSGPPPLSQCFTALTSGLAEAEALPPIAEASGCGADDVVRLDAVILKD